MTDHLSVDQTANDRKSTRAPFKPCDGCGVMISPRDNRKRCAPCSADIAAQRQRDRERRKREKAP